MLDIVKEIKVIARTHQLLNLQQQVYAGNAASPIRENPSLDLFALRKHGQVRIRHFMNSA
jgi:hypothetical protein